MQGDLTQVSHSRLLSKWFICPTIISQKPRCVQGLQLWGNRHKYWILLIFVCEIQFYLILNPIHKKGGKNSIWTKCCACRPAIVIQASLGRWCFSWISPKSLQLYLPHSRERKKWQCRSRVTMLAFRKVWFLTHQRL